MKKPLWSVAAALVFALATAARAELVYRPGEGWHTEAETGAPAANANAELHRAQQLENNGDTKQALAAYRTVAHKWPDSSPAVQAQLKVGELYEKLGDYNRAFDSYGAYISKYPRGEEFERAVEAQFNIARLFLEGEKKRVLGVPIASSMTRAQEMFEAIVKNAPYSKFAPLAQFNAGQALEKQGKFPEAIAAYQAVLIKYSNDPVAADAQYQIGYIYLKESRSFDPAAAAKARAAFEDFSTRYPGSEKIAQAQENLKNLSGRETKGSFEIAKFYDKQKQYKAAVIYYQDVIRQQPGSPESNAAKERIEALKQQVGEETLRPGPERTETGARAQSRRRLQARVDTAARPDYQGPPVVVPDEVAPQRPRPRTSPGDVVPVPGR